MDTTAGAVLDFWFGAQGTPLRGQSRPEWFRKDPMFDDSIRRAFGDAIHRALAGGYGEWCVDARGALARVLLLDQFTRNVFRDTPQAFAGDARALATAQDGVARGFDRALDAEFGRFGRWFFYLPFEHAEDVAIQHRALELFGALSADSGDGDALLWAQKHADIVFRFGRYPHRNAILARESTPEEIAFLAEPGSRF